ncbi:MFS family permease [Pseudomonas sp. JUb42]|jgi:MFS family permease|uniref:MFS transporter n=1 Tax=Pseudomonas sp. JUb42 TaxID=2940611 RepID=UPI002167A9EA|nr:MFS transporter [Pseudomonas sp. JUb42]MCS3472188.1 MFS family permease [Pseudomonas sp. JUb42]
MDSLPRRVVLQLGLAQLINWGVTFYLPGAFAPAIVADTGWGGQQVFAGLSVALLVMGLISPLSGPLIQRLGGRRLMQIGALLNASGCIGLSLCSTSGGYFAAWALLGLGMRLSLYDTLFATLAGLAGAAARPVMVQITLLGGLASAVFWPLGHGLLDAYGWRTGIALYGVLALCSGLLLSGLPNAAAAPAQQIDQAPATVPWPRKLGYALSVTLISFISAGLSAHLPGLLLDFNLPLWLAALWGIGQTCSRLAQSLLARSLSALRLNVWVGMGLSLSFAIGLCSQGRIWLACVFVFGYGAMNGLATLLRASLPFELFEHGQYAQLVGRLLAPGFVCAAAAPWCYAAVREVAGDEGMLGLSLGLALVVLTVARLLSRVGARLAREDVSTSDRGC